MQIETREQFMNLIPMVKFAGCWICVIASFVMLIANYPFANVAGALAILAIAIAQVPDTW